MIYLDHAAATPVSPSVLGRMAPFFTTDFFNPSAAYLPAKHVAAAYTEAKAVIAHAIGAKATDLVITGSATEANNLAMSVVEKEGKILCLATEHDSVHAVVDAHNQGGAFEISVHHSGIIDLDDLRAKITDQVELISVALVTSDLGVIQPLSEIATILREVKEARRARGITRPLYLHSDASQAPGLLKVSVARLGVDLLTLNSAKIGGPKGVGALYLSSEVQRAALKPQILGGGQERGLRSGTENVPGVIGFAAALSDAVTHIEANRQKYAAFRQILLSELQGHKLVSPRHALDNFIVLCYNGIDAERLLYRLEEDEVYVATGAACAASKGKRSRALAALGLTDAEIAGSLRLSLGSTNTEEQMHAAANFINQAVSEERNYA